MRNPFQSIEQMQAALDAIGYLADRTTATTAYLALLLERPIFVEGYPGVGKTELAKALAKVLGRQLVRLQCYEGIDRQSALYDWNYAAQMLYLRMAEGRTGLKTPGLSALRQEIYSADFLIDRPLLACVRASPSDTPVLLIDEVDRSDEAFEAFLLEFLSDFQVSIPEVGTITAQERPLVILTSNRTRDIHDALRRRCLYQWMDYPTVDRELAIIERKVPGIAHSLARQIVAFVALLRQKPLVKPPGLAESLEWAEALSRLGVTTLSLPVVSQTLGCLVKYYDDLELLNKNGADQTSNLKLWLAEVGVVGDA